MKKGYTLIELLAVIVILTILFFVAYAGVSQYITESNNKTFIAYEKNLKDIGEEYFNNEINSTTFLKQCLSIKKMIQKKYIKDYIDVKDPDLPHEYYFLKSYNNKNGNVCDGYVILELVNSDLTITPYLECGPYNYETNAIGHERMTDGYSDSEKSTCDD